MIYQRLLGACLVLLGSSSLSWAQGKSETLIVAGPRTPESAELEYPATEAVHEMRRNIYERLLAYEMTTNKDGVRVEDFDKLTGALAESPSPSTSGRPRQVTATHLPPTMSCGLSTAAGT
jgi:peptide/nickel transport system substrate-binding protein